MEKEANIAKVEESKQADPIESTICDMCRLSLHQQRYATHSRTAFDLPLEILAIVLDLLPQHRVYPFLSLSKDVDRCAKKRLLRQVYVLKRGDKPLLHDAVEDLWYWLFLTDTQFLHLMRHEVKWPGQTVIMEMCWFGSQLTKLIEEHVKPAEVIHTGDVYYMDSTPPRNKVSLILKSWTTPHLARLTIDDYATIEPIPVKLKVDSLQLFGDVRGLDGCIDLSSVKQLSIVNAESDKDGNIYKLAPHFTNLRDLQITEQGITSFDLGTFPKTIKRLVISWSYALDYDARPFEQLLEYFEICEGARSQSWPRRLLTVSHDPFLFGPTLYMFPKLKLVVHYDVVYRINRILGEYAPERINEIRFKDGHKPPLGS